VKTKLEKNQIAANPLFTLKYSKNDKEISRFAVIVSKKIDFRAVARNRVRRQIASCIGEMLERIVPGVDFLFIVKKEAIGKKTIEICSAIDSIIRKESLIK
jgi:ribonuclease P protein component